MALEKGQEVYFKKLPRTIHGTVVKTIDEGPGKDPSVIVQRREIRCHASDLESAELPESQSERFLRVMSGPLAQIPQEWAANPEDPELKSKMAELLRELGLVKPIPRK